MALTSEKAGVDGLLFSCVSVRVLLFVSMGMEWLASS
jgi:hypothetical protein